MIVGSEPCDVVSSGCINCVIQAGWECPINVCNSLCSNNALNSGEECEDGNLNDGDGCSSLCNIEKGWSCLNTPCTIVCGDSIFID